jgi:Domain of unknown function (DUF4926)
MAERHPEHSRVALSQGVDSRDGWVPAGTRGTVVHVYPDEAAYLIEFTRPVQTIAMVKASFVAEE